MGWKWEDERAMWAGSSKWAGWTVRDKRCGISHVGGWGFIQEVDWAMWDEPFRGERCGLFR